jgi:hypothetical protein
VEENDRASVSIDTTTGDRLLALLRRRLGSLFSFPIDITMMPIKKLHANKNKM